MTNSPDASLRNAPSTTAYRSEEAGQHFPRPSDCHPAIHLVAHARLSPNIDPSEVAAAIEALRESEARFRMLADNMSQLAWTCDLLGNVTWYNKRWLDYTGLTFEEMKGWGWGKVQHPDHVDRVVARVKRSAETGEPWEDIFPLRGKDGTYRWFLSRALPIRDERGNFVQWFGTNTDITEQVLAEEKVARQARELQALNVQLNKEIADRERTEETSRHHASIVRGSQDAIVSTDLNGIVTSWNEGAERLYGYRPEEMIGNSVTILIPEDRPNEEVEILARIRRGESIEHYEVIRRRKDGSPIDISLTVSPIEDDAGRIVGASKIARDISKRKQAQERQQLLNRELQHRTRNLFALVQAVVARSFAGKLSIKEAETAILSRLRSLAATHVMLVDQDWKGADLADVVRTEMEAYVDRVTVEGPKLVLSPKAAQNFALALHELATNAVKYGALSTPAGRVHISWSVAESNGDAALTFRWQEQDGPLVTAPKRKGFGSTVLEQVMAGCFEAPPRINYASSGISYELSGSLASISPNEQQGS